jgi:FAD/FMN-containing dehydrogenase
MKNITISPDGTCATLQPGLTSSEVMRALRANNNTTTTGGCLCTGVMGVSLGGGHGYLQGLLGYPAIRFSKRTSF